MNDSPNNDIAEFFDEVWNRALSTQTFARKVQARFLAQQARATELRLEAEELLDQIRSRRRSETDVPKPFIVRRSDEPAGSAARDRKGP